MRPPALRSVLFAVALPAAAALALGGCGAESVAPEDDNIVDFPGEAATLQEAVNMAQLGGQIVVADGQHTVDAPVVIPTGKPGLILRGADGTRPRLTFTVNPDSVDAIIVLAPDCSVRSLEIDGTYRVGILYLPSGSEGTGDVTDCIVRDAGLYAVEAGSAAANITVERNILVNPAVFGFIVANGATAVVRNNTIVGAGDCGIYADFSIGFSEFICERNILAQNTIYGIACFSPAPPTLDCNVLFGNGVSAYSPECNAGPADQETDPMFCETTTYTLLPGSPCAPANAGACQGIGAVTTVCSQ